MDISKWDVSNVKHLDRAFYGALSFSEDLCDWGEHLANLEDAKDMFVGTDCDDKGDPIPGSNPPGPLCSADTCPALPQE